MNSKSRKAGHLYSLGNTEEPLVLKASYVVLTAYVFYCRVVRGSLRAREIMRETPAEGLACLLAPLARCDSHRHLFPQPIASAHLARLTGCALCDRGRCFYSFQKLKRTIYATCNTLDLDEDVTTEKLSSSSLWCS